LVKENGEVLRVSMRYRFMYGNTLVILKRV
jgi:hypothetical protein